MSTSAEAIKQIQTILAATFPEVVVDGDVGPHTLAALERLDEMAARERALNTATWPGKHTTGKASFFAGPQDTAAFQRCKARGGTDMQCFAVGDNGVGRWGRDCTSRTQPIAALPKEVWQLAGKTDGDALEVTYKGKTIPGILGDTLPALDNIKNGVVIDLNPAFAIQFGIKPEEMNNHTLDEVTWKWV